MWKKIKQNSPFISLDMQWMNQSEMRQRRKKIILSNVEKSNEWKSLDDENSNTIDTRHLWYWMFYASSLWSICVFSLMCLFVSFSWTNIFTIFLRYYRRRFCHTSSILYDIWWLKIVVLNVIYSFSFFACMHYTCLNFWYFK